MAVVCAAGGACNKPGFDVVVVERNPGDEGEGEGEGEEGEGEGEGAEGEGEGEGEGTVVVGHDRELRGAWIATVYGINWPSSSSASAAVKQQELIDLIDEAADAGLNALFFQVRPESDALYASSLEPWSRFLTGVQGGDPGFDPLDTAIAHAHARGVELHAWINPYRGLTSQSVVSAQNHVSRTLSAAAVDYDGMVWMNPASQAVQDHVVDVVVDIISRYDVDGIHMDDYFYPYPDGSTSFPDAADFSAYQDGGGSLTKSAWRRENVNTLIEATSLAIASVRPSVRFGVSPFGIYRPGTPAGITGLDAYEAISCDPVTWLAMDWVDYLAPQLYWPTTQTRQAFGTLLPWWASLTDGDGRFVVAGINLAAYDPSGAFTLDEYRAEIAITRAHSDDGAKGTILYHVDPLVSDDDVKGAFAALNARKVLPPPVVLDTRLPEVPTLAADGADVVVTSENAKGFVVYDVSGDDPVVSDIVFGQTLRLAPSSSPRAVTAFGQNDRESAGVSVP
jgi:uncharacterized lipoprotein YddW (UPF0748 family)